MNTSRYTPKLIVKENLHFNIPIYQRLFAWGKEEIKGLLYDLKEHFEKAPGQSPYYLGMLSCIGRGDSFDLIDGQQRFTVVMLIGIVFREYDDEHGARWKEFIEEDRQDCKRLDFTARPQDRDYLLSIINKEPSDYCNEKMDDAIKEIRWFMERNFRSEEEKKTFAMQVYERLSFFFSVLPDEYMNDPSSLNKYFESMNSAGKGLEQHEIIKVQLLKGQSGQEWLTRIWNSVSDMSRPIIKKNEDISYEGYRKLYVDAITKCQDGLFEEAFKQCESSFDKEDDTEIGMIEAKMRVKEESYNQDTSNRSILSFPEFLMMVLDIHLSINGSYSFYRTELIRAFKDHAITDIPAFYNQLLFYRLLFDYYIITLENNANGNRYTVIINSNDKGNQSEIECVCQYESMLYVSQTPFYNWLKPLLLELSSLQNVDCGKLLKMLKAIDNKLRKEVPAVESLSYKSNPDRYWFWRLDYFLWENREKYFTEEEQQDIVNDYIFRSNRSIEHLHPQDQKQNTIWEEDKIHSFGNLAMISPGFNSQQNNDPVTVKFARISDQAQKHALQSIKLYSMFLAAKGSPEGWTPDIMKDHEEKMHNILVDSFKE